MNRRNFLRVGVGAATFLSAATRLRAQGANDAIRLAIVGMGSKVKIGGMGRNDMRACRTVPGSGSRRSAMSIPSISVMRSTSAPNTTRSPRPLPTTGNCWNARISMRSGSPRRTTGTRWCVSTPPRPASMSLSRSRSATICSRDAKWSRPPAPTTAWSTRPR